MTHGCAFVGCPRAAPAGVVEKTWLCRAHMAAWRAVAPSLSASRWDWEDAWLAFLLSGVTDDDVMAAAR